jgi:hypothetical protein
VVFLYSPYRETSKNVLKKKSEEKKMGLVGSSKVNQIYVKVRHFFFLVPLGKKAAPLRLHLPRKPETQTTKTGTRKERVRTFFASWCRCTSVCRGGEGSAAPSSRIDPTPDTRPVGPAPLPVSAYPPAPLSIPQGLAAARVAPVVPACAPLPLPAAASPFSRPSALCPCLSFAPPALGLGSAVPLIAESARASLAQLLRRMPTPRAHVPPAQHGTGREYSLLAPSTLR